MVDQRCNCGSAYCVICERNRTGSADLGSAQPWTPRPGVTPPDIAQVEEDGWSLDSLEAVRRWERWQTVRRYLLVLLLTLTGGLVGGVIGALACLYTFN